MDVFTAITPQYILSKSVTALIENAAIVVVDGNFPADTIRTICASARHYQVPIWFEPTSIPKCTKILEADALNMLTCILN
jgi:hypothetical protein